jgi:hypothetical protein
MFKWNEGDKRGSCHNGECGLCLCFGAFDGIMEELVLSSFIITNGMKARSGEIGGFWQETGADHSESVASP